jgi:hypothetical protein
LGDEAADLRNAIKGVERHYRQAKTVATAMAERVPEVRLH